MHSGGKMRICLRERLFDHIISLCDLDLWPFDFKI